MHFEFLDEDVWFKFNYECSKLKGWNLPSKAAIFQRFTNEQIGIAYCSLRDIGSLKDGPYQNKKCTIWQGELIASQGKQKEE